MKLIFKIIILFLIIFKFRVPVVYDTAFLSILLCSIYYLLTRGTLPFTYFFYRHTITILVGLAVICIIIAAITTFHGEYDFLLLTILALQFVMLCALIYALPLLLEGEEEHAFESCLFLICYAFATQGFIQLMAFLIPPLGDFMISIKPEETQQMLSGTAYKIYFRGYALSGSIFFELPAGFGLAYMALVRLLAIEEQKYITGYKLYIIFILLFVGSMFSGRTSFIGLAIAVVMGILLIKSPFQLLIKNFSAILGFIILFAVIYGLVLPSRQKQILIDDVFPFAFEFYYNYEESGRLSTSSSDAMIYSHYYWLPDKTLLHGDGRIAGINGGFYGETDAGYMRNALYGGIPFIICLVIYQWLYVMRPLSISVQRRWTREGYGDFICFLMFFMYIFILEYKGSALGFMNIMEVLLFFLGSSYLVRYYYREENDVIVN
jgi:hypothetical protein